MAAGGSKVTSLSSRGAHTAQGASVRREGTAPSPSLEVFVPTIDSLDEIAGWLGTFRERLRLASTEDRADVAVVVDQLEARFRQRRAELS
jgi:hypothetical protein